MSLKNKYLTVASSGLFVRFTPPETDRYFHDIEAFLQANSLDSVETFNLYELQFFLALQSQRDVQAKAYLDRIVDQFNSQHSQRIKLLQLIYLEAVGDVEGAVAQLGSNPDEMKLSRRLTTFSKEAGSNANYITNLNFYLDLQPSDLITWAELGDEYAKAGAYDKAVFAWQEVVLQEPLAYNALYKVGLYSYYQLLSQYDAKAEKKDKLLEWVANASHSRDYFLRALEISDNYVKAWAGVYAVSNLKLNDKLRGHRALSSTKAATQFLADAEKLSALAKRKLEAEGVAEAELKLEI